MPVPVLLYHAITEESPRGLERLTVRPSLFHEHTRAIADAGRVALTVTELAEALRGRLALPSRPVLMTFDDGFADTLNAVELLLGGGLAASVYVTIGLLGRPAMLTGRAVRALDELGGRVEVGAHALRHTRLDELSGAERRSEIIGSKSALEQILRKPVQSFAYPYGAYDRSVRQAVIDAGYTAAAAVKNALSHEGDDPFALARVTVTARTTAREIEALLAGSGAPLAWRRERVRTSSYRRVRRLRRAVGWAVASWP
jgi:peptidoglycan/xylan/chitin deacetylase (PgdA/CDA1 family)